MGTPKSSNLMGFPLINHPSLGYPQFRKPAYSCIPHPPRVTLLRCNTKCSAAEAQRAAQCSQHTEGPTRQWRTSLSNIESQWVVSLDSQLFKRWENGTALRCLSKSPFQKNELELISQVCWKIKHSWNMLKPPTNTARFWSLPSLWSTHLGPYLVSMGYAIKNCMSISSAKKTLVMILKIPIQEKRSPSKKPASKGVKIATKMSKKAQSVSHFLVAIRFDGNRWM